MADSHSAVFDILLVEDNPGDRDLIMAYLERSGKSFHVETAGSLDEALRKPKGRNFNIVLLDLGLSDSIGLDTLTQFRSHAPDIPIIVLTGLDDERTGLEAIRIGAQDYLIKGQVSANLLLRSMRHAIERHTLKGRYQNLFNNMQQGVIYQDANGRVTQANPSALRILGISLEKILDRESTDPAWETIHPDGTVCPGRDHPSMRALRSGRPETDLVGVPNPMENAIRWIKVYAVPECREPGEKPEGVFTTFEDITDLRQAERDLCENEELIKSQHRFLQLLMDAIPISVFYKDTRGIYIGCNNTYATLLGKSKEEVIGKTVYDVYPADLANRYRRMDLELLANPGIQQHESRITGKDGISRDVLFNNATYFDDTGHVGGIIGAMLDITDRKEMEKRLQQSQKMEAIGTLAGGIAHDFNNILSSIIGFTELSLDDVEKGSEIEINLQEVYAAGKRAKDLVKQILIFARRSDEEIKPIQPIVIAKEVLKFIRSSIPANIDIKPDLESHSFIMGNVTQIHQVLMNLCTNAAQAMEEKGGCLEMKLKDIVVNHHTSHKGMGLMHGNYIEIQISDTGTGIDKNIIGSIFEPYFTTKNPGEGTGLGLAMVHGIVEAYGGKITVSSTPGIGTTFTIYLPISRKERTDSPYNSDSLPLGTENILFVDDEESIAKMGGQILERLNYSVTTKTSSVEALALFRSNPNDFDLVISDMTMSHMTGDRLAAELMKIRPDIPVILCTGYSKKLSDKSPAAEIGVKAFAYKPIVKADLAKIVRNVLDETEKKS